MLGVADRGDVEVLVPPPTAAPRRNPKKRSRLITEHRKRKGDPAMGGSTRAPIMPRASPASAGLRLRRCRMGRGASGDLRVEMP